MNPTFFFWIHLIILEIVLSFTEEFRQSRGSDGVNLIKEERRERKRGREREREREN